MLICGLLLLKPVLIHFCGDLISNREHLHAGHPAASLLTTVLLKSLFMFPLSFQGVTHHIRECYPGPLVVKELQYLGQYLDTPKRYTAGQGA
jgi:hypothetical protein